MRKLFFILLLGSVAWGQALAGKAGLVGKSGLAGSTSGIILAPFVHGAQAVASVTPMTAALPGGSTNGNTLVVGCNVYSTNTCGTPTDTLGDTFTACLNAVHPEAFDTTYIFVAPVTGTTGANTVSVANAGSSNMEIVVAEYTGTWACDKTSSASNATTSWTSGSTATTAFATEILIGFSGYTDTSSSGMTLATSGAMTQRFVQNVSGTGASVFQDAKVTSTGTYSALATSSITPPHTGTGTIATLH